MVLENLENYFRPDVRNAGRRFYEAEKVSSSHPSDVEVRAYVRAASAFKVSLKTESVGSGRLFADCSCPEAKKGRLCKHVWAALLKTSEAFPDFLESKIEIEKMAAAATADARVPRLSSEAQVVARAAAKVKREEYRKAQYEKQKVRAKEIRLAKKGYTVVKLKPVLPLDVEEALAYFDRNGFRMEAPPRAEELALAKKQLSRVFHPDKGGTHEEILELNAHFETLIGYLNG